MPASLVALRERPQLGIWEALVDMVGIWDKGCGSWGSCSSPARSPAPPGRWVNSLQRSLNGMSAEMTKGRMGLDRPYPCSVSEQVVLFLALAWLYDVKASGFASKSGLGHHSSNIYQLKAIKRDTGKQAPMGWGSFILRGVNALDLGIVYSILWSIVGGERYSKSQYQLRDQNYQEHVIVEIKVLWK